jgi:hypothetical protein
MNRDETITQILHLSASPRDREAHTRAALDRMGSVELTQTRENLAARGARRFREPAMAERGRLAAGTPAYGEGR